MSAREGLERSPRAGERTGTAAPVVEAGAGYNGTQSRGDRVAAPATASRSRWSTATHSRSCRSAAWRRKRTGASAQASPLPVSCETWRRSGWIGPSPRC